jgi:large exoprotein involved in heme utilization and adhesion
MVNVSLACFSTTEGIGKAGDLTITTPVLLVRDGAQVDASTIGSGDGGSLSVNASESVQLIGTITTANGQYPSGLFTSTESTGKAGSLTITTPILLVRDGARVDTSTRGSGNGGSLNVNASESVQVIGTTADRRVGSGLIASNSRNRKGRRLDDYYTQLLIFNGAEATVSSLGEGIAGNIGIIARFVRLDNGKIIAQTRSGNGGNLTLSVADLLLLRRGSEISTTAGTAQAGGNGGNIILILCRASSLPEQGKITTSPLMRLVAVEGESQLTLPVFWYDSAYS